MEILQQLPWTTGYVYHVVDDITVPENNTLTINAGVRVKFVEGKGMVVNGKLIANGTEEENIIFTSKEPTPTPGDWDNLELHGRDNHISYLKYDYATNGITGSGVDHTTIDNVIMQGTLALNSYGINFASGDSLTLTNNQLVVGAVGIAAHDASYSTIQNNEIIAPKKEFTLTIVVFVHFQIIKLVFLKVIMSMKVLLQTILSKLQLIITPCMLIQEELMQRMGLSKRLHSIEFLEKYIYHGLDLRDSDSSIITDNYIYKSEQSTHNWEPLLQAQK